MRIGIDIGSREVKLVSVNNGDNPISDQRLIHKRYDTIEFYTRFRGKEGSVGTIPKMDIDLKIIGIDTDKFDGPLKVTATGYGKNNINIKGVDIIPEIKAHTEGALFQTGLRDFTLVDMGGQDTKVVKVRNGMVEDFIMNDKCAAGSGRYLENIARVMGVSLKELGRYYKEPVELSATCAIFGESEIISRITEGYTIPQLCAGANKTIIKRLLPMLNRFQSKILIITGGVAKNDAIRRLIASCTDFEVIVPPYPQLNGAIGCCISQHTLCSPELRQ